MRILFVHQTFPRQYRHLAASLSFQHDVVEFSGVVVFLSKAALADVGRGGCGIDRVFLPRQGAAAPGVDTADG